MQHKRNPTQQLIAQGQPWLPAHAHSLPCPVQCARWLHAGARICSTGSETSSHAWNTCEWRRGLLKGWEVGGRWRKNLGGLAEAERE